MPDVDGSESSSTLQPCWDCFSLTIFRPDSSGDASSWQPVTATAMPLGEITESVLLNAASEETSSMVTLPPVVNVRSVALAFAPHNPNESIRNRKIITPCTEREC